MGIAALGQPSKVHPLLIVSVVACGIALVCWGFAAIVTGIHDLSLFTNGKVKSVLRWTILILHVLALACFAVGLAALAAHWIIFVMSNSPPAHARTLLWLIIAVELSAIWNLTNNKSTGFRLRTITVEI